MKMVIFTLGSRGDVQPYVALAKAAILKGHRAVICTGKSFQALIEENGVEFEQATSDLMAMLETEEGKMIVTHPLRHPIKTKHYLNTVVNPAFRQTLDDFYRCAKGASVIIYHPKALGTPDIAKALGIPCVSIPPIPITYPIEEFPNLAIHSHKNFGKILNKLTYTLMGKAESASIKEVNDFREKTLGLPKRKSGVYAFEIDGKEIPIIYPVSKALFPEVKSWENKVSLPGFFYLKNEGEALEARVAAFIQAGPAPVVLTFSSMPVKSPARFQAIVTEALRETGDRAIIVIGNSGLSFESKEDQLILQAVPHHLLFPLAKGIIHHGGVGTMAAALKSGRPQLIIPFAVDQPFWAHRLARLGYALEPLTEKQLTKEKLVQRLNEFNYPKVKQQAQAIRQIILIIENTAFNDTVVVYFPVNFIVSKINRTILIDSEGIILLVIMPTIQIAASIECAVVNRNSFTINDTNFKISRLHNGLDVNIARSRHGNSQTVRIFILDDVTTSCFNCLFQFF